MLHKLFLLTILSSALPAIAALKVELLVKPHHGPMELQVFERAPKGYVLNGLNLPPMMVYQNTEALRTILQKVEGKIGNCEAGQYSLSIKNKKNVNEVGCMESDRYAQIRSAFYRLQGY